MSKQVEVPEEIQRFSVGPDPEHPGFSEMHPSDAGHWIHIHDLEAIYKHFSDRLLSKEVIHELTKEIVEGSDGEVISLPYAVFKDALQERLAALQATSIPTTSDEEGPDEPVADDDTCRSCKRRLGEKHAAHCFIAERIETVRPNHLEAPDA